MGGFLSSLNAENEWRNDARFAMESGCFCVICGGQFDMEGNAHNIDAKERQYRWLSEFRIVGNLPGIANHNMTGEAIEPVNTSDHTDVFLSEKGQFTMTGSGYFSVGSGLPREGIWFDPLRADAKHNTIFALHEACIDIGCKAITLYQAECSTSRHWSPLALLNHVLQDRYRKALSSSQDFKTDILGLCTVSDTYGPRSVICLSKIDWWAGAYEKFLADPISIPDLSSFALTILQATPNRKEDTRRLLQPTRQALGLERLPTEILDQICGHLQASSTIRLHRVSKTLALKVSLDNSFWRKGLLDGSLLPHIWDLEKKELGNSIYEATCDWKSVAKVLSNKRFPLIGRDPRLNNIPKGLWNRCRVWNILEEAVHSYFQIHEKYHCAGAKGSP